jgi:hypothetical protein
MSADQLVLDNTLSELKIGAWHSLGDLKYRLFRNQKFKQQMDSTSEKKTVSNKIAHLTRNYLSSMKVEKLPTLLYINWICLTMFNLII